MCVCVCERERERGGGKRVAVGGRGVPYQTLHCRHQNRSALRLAVVRVMVVFPQGACVCVCVGGGGGGGGGMNTSIRDSFRIKM